MIFIGKPDEDQVNSFLLEQHDKNFTYRDVKGTLEYNSIDAYKQDEKYYKNYCIDHFRQKIGEGEDVFRKAIQGFRSWRQFNMDWVQLYYPDTPLEAGRDVVVVARSFGVWTGSACRIVYVLHEGAMDAHPWKRFGFAYGTLEQHVESGEERFLLEWNTETKEVFYSIFSFSAQNLWFTKLGYPVARYFQKTFHRDSLKALTDYVLHDGDNGKLEVMLV